ncbi:uncharacterized protein Z518_07200 [Rhinocladiella mackenziei CBS 650.93]|uniref:Rhinocladiella mackenziei CBS 650.93 unplaced genomic scaffold supercont1.5, whole genome shotgun sequence n=1 Tax=Rhinocladiella mackenziei CBS 650.93 TaxID=1442369 RepID=A0A0D2FNK7_9EURO|nr:uncharacterized protein Z518_07200 [Rhinocladiella mackenziei CBS 650.93]KIX03647.1 hypothetical protein Z518_07200 [Rhinocladiella mackenziei CBS 650.93]
MRIWVKVLKTYCDGAIAKPQLGFLAVHRNLLLYKLLSTIPEGENIETQLPVEVNTQIRYDKRRPTEFQPAHPTSFDRLFDRGDFPMSNPRLYQVLAYRLKAQIKHDLAALTATSEMQSFAIWLAMLGSCLPYRFPMKYQGLGSRTDYAHRLRNILLPDACDPGAQMAWEEVSWRLKAPVNNQPLVVTSVKELPHIHLISKYRYPITSNPSLETIVGYLLEAPKIVRDLQPMQWQFIETPPDGTLMLTWQPLDYLGTTFASDGFIWADQEHVFKSEVRGYTLEMFLQRSGYRAQGEAMATHSRRRYRLLPGNPNLGLPNPDPSLWLTHYSKASPRDHVPAASIVVPPYTHAQLQQRRMIQSQGQLPRKEFMLSDRSSWPTIHLPPAIARASAPPIPPAASHRRATSIGQDPTLEEEEDVSRGDLLDFVTPRDISRVRYEQHHEWMEEILESPYPTSSIIPSDLGLGRKGQLEELTKDFFDAPVSAQKEPNSGPPPRVGKMPAGQADDFVKRAEAKLADMGAELEKIRKTHARRMEKFKRSSTLTVAERKLRTTPNFPERQSLGNDVDNAGTASKPRDAVEEIMATVEAETGRKLVKTTAITIASRGGLEERVKIPPATNGLAALAVASSEKAANSTPTNNPQQAQPPPMTTTTITTAAAAASSEEKPQEKASERPTNTNTDAQPTRSATQDDQSTAADLQGETVDQHRGTDLPQLDDIGVDVNMDGLDDENGDNGNQGGNEWVMIDEDGGQDAEEMDLPDIPTGDQSNENQAAAPENATHSSEQTTNPPQQTNVQPGHDTPLDTPDFDMGGDFDNVEVDTAGDALASYGNDEDDLNLDPMEDSAFGDAFHPEEDEDIS